MQVTGRLIGLLVLVALLSPLTNLPILVGAQGHGPVLDQQVIELEEMRLINLSPDGNLLAATDGAQLCVYTVELLEESACADLSVLGARLRIQDVTWSPDSTRLALTGEGYQVYQTSDLWILDAMTGEMTNLTGDGVEGNVRTGDDDDGILEYTVNISPAWTPDGSAITFATSRSGGDQFHGTQIVSVPADGGEITELISIDPSLPGLVYFPMHGSRDGQFLYYSVTYLQTGDFRSGIYRYSAADGKISAVVPPDAESGPATLLQVSPAGDRLLGMYLMDIQQFREGAIWVFDLENEELTRLTHPESEDRAGAHVTAVSFAPDGSSILLGTTDGDDGDSVWELTGADLEPVLLAEDLPGLNAAVTNMTVSWSAQGRILLPANIGMGKLLEVAPSEAPPNVSPATPVPPAESSAPVPGETVSVASIGVPLHAAPSATAPAVLLLDESARLAVIGPPEEVEAVVWVPVQDEATRTIGFVRAEQLRS